MLSSNLGPTLRGLATGKARLDGKIPFDLSRGNSPRPSLALQPCRSAPSQARPHKAAKSGENHALWCDQAFETSFPEALRTNGTAKRAEPYRKATSIFHEQAPWIPLAHPKLFNVRRSNIDGYTISPLTNNNFANIQVKQ